MQDSPGISKTKNLSPPAATASGLGQVGDGRWPRHLDGLWPWCGIWPLAVLTAKAAKAPSFPGRSHHGVRQHGSADEAPFECTAGTVCDSHGSFRIKTGIVVSSYSSSVFAFIIVIIIVVLSFHVHLMSHVSSHVHLHHQHRRTPPTPVVLVVVAFVTVSSIIVSIVVSTSTRRHHRRHQIQHHKTPSKAKGRRL